MNRNERVNDPVIALLSAMQGVQAGLWTALPGKVVSFDATDMTVSVEPMIQARLTAQDGTVVWIDLPLLVDVPVIFPSAGGYSLTFPVKPDDECLVVFASRNIDTWWDQGTKGPVNDLRMHDLSDGFALLGPRTRPNPIPSIASDGVALRNEAGTAVIKINDAQTISITTTGDVTVTAGGDVAVQATGTADIVAGGDISVVTPGSITLNAPEITALGNLAVGGNLDVGGTVVDGTGKDLGTHTHTQNNVNQPNTGPPT